MNQPDEARIVYAHFRWKKIKEDLSNKKIDLFEKVWLIMESLLWGLPTGFGTKIGRITLISLLALAICAIPTIIKKGILVEVPYKKSVNKNTQSRVSKKLFIPHNLDQLQTGARSPLSLSGRILISLSFVFALMFKFRLYNMVYVEHQRIAGRHAFEKYFISLWLLGSVLLALLGLTLANTSPVLKKLIGEIIF